MNANQTLDKVREGLDLSFMEITAALFETGDLVDKTDKHWLQRESAEFLLCHPEGMTSWAISKALGVDPNVMRVSLNRNPQIYIHAWIQGRSGRQAALYKAVDDGLKAPKDAVLACDTKARERRLKEAGHKLQGLTKWVVLQ